jgi:hypothetical protein
MAKAPKKTTKTAETEPVKAEAEVQEEIQEKPAPEAPAEHKPGPAKESETLQTIKIEYETKQELLKLLSQGRTVKAIEQAVIRRHPGEEAAIRLFLS